MAIEFEVVTLFPAMIEAQLSGGVVKRALDRGLARVGCVDPRAFAKDAHRTVDDRPYGGGPGMVMKPDVWRWPSMRRCDACRKAVVGCIYRHKVGVLIKTKRGRWRAGLA